MYFMWAVEEKKHLVGRRLPLVIDVTACQLWKSPSIIHYTVNGIFSVVSSCLTWILVNLAPKTKVSHLNDLFTLLSGFKRNVSRASGGGKTEMPQQDGPKIQFQVGAHNNSTFLGGEGAKKNSVRVSCLFSTKKPLPETNSEFTPGNGWFGIRGSLPFKARPPHLEDRDPGRT